MIEDIEKYQDEVIDEQEALEEDKLDEEELDDIMDKIESTKNRDAMVIKESVLKEISIEKNHELKFNRRLKLIKTARKMVKPVAFTLPVIISVVITGGTFKLVNANPFVREERLYEEHIEEDKNDSGVVYQSLKYIQYNHKKDKGFSDTAKIDFSFYTPWMAEEDYYKRNVTNYGINADIALKNFVGKHVEDITVEDILACGFEERNSYSERAYNLSLEEINAPGYVNMHSKYISQLVEMKQTKEDNKNELGVAFVEFIIAYCLSLGIISFVDFLRHQNGNGIQDILNDYECKYNNKLQKIAERIEELKGTYDKYSYTNEEADAELNRILNEDEEETKDAITK